VGFFTSAFYSQPTYDQLPARHHENPEPFRKEPKANS